MGTKEGTVIILPMHYIIKAEGYMYWAMEVQGEVIFI